MQCHSVKACLVYQLKQQQEKTYRTAVLPFVTEKNRNTTSVPLKPCISLKLKIIILQLKCSEGSILICI